MRSPFLQMGGDTQFSMLYNNNFDYDCSWPTRFIFHSLRFDEPDKIVLGRAFGYMDAEIGLYPYTMGFESVQVELTNSTILFLTNRILFTSYREYITQKLKCRFQ